MNLKGLYCPIPYIKTLDALRDLKSGDILVVEATDPGFYEDVLGVEITGTARILDRKRIGKLVVVRIEKTG